MDFVLAAIKVFLTVSTCNSTIFSLENDAYQTNELACVSNPKKVKAGIAHRTLPCGSRVLLFNPRTLMATVAKVVDRGPYGAVYDGQWRLKRTSRGKGTWRGCLDLDNRVAKAIRHNGYESLVFMRMD